jgi:hypothetical protein
MIYKYSELKGKIKVGDIVRAVPGKDNYCGELNDDGSNTAKITAVTNVNFFINDCDHSFKGSGYLEIVNEEKTLETLEVGDTVIYDSCWKKDILAVLHRNGEKTVYVMSEVYKDENDTRRKKIDATWTAYELELRDFSYPQPQEEMEEVTMEQVCEKFGKNVKIKK